jgi:serine/threonine-protein kinase
VQAPGRAEVVIPALIERGGHWDGVAPGAAETAPVVLPIEGALGPDDRGVPAGWCWIGGDPFAAESLPRRRVWIDGFVMRRFPVTNQEYVDFLNDLVASGRADEALAACPKSVPGRRDAGEPELPRDPEGRFHLLPGEHQPDAPVVAVDWYGAAAYARWLAARTGRAWRLPNELEREKAARGVDGRFCPWGDHLDATFACTVDSSAGNLVLAPVTSYPLDESPYGVRGLGGNTRDWCHNVWRHGGPRLEGDRLVLDLAGDDDAGPTVPRAVRGGGYISSVSMSRSACRFALHPALRRSLVGLRLVRPW